VPVIIPTRSDVKDNGVRSCQFTTAARAKTPARPGVAANCTRLGGDSTTSPSRSYVTVTMKGSSWTLGLIG
jgi:hypothetical protein